MSNIKLVEDSRETGIAFLKRMIEQLEEEGVELEEVILVAQRKGGGVEFFNNEMKGRDLAYYTIMFNQWVNHTL